MSVFQLNQAARPVATLKDSGEIQLQTEDKIKIRLVSQSTITMDGVLSNITRGFLAPSVGQTYIQFPTCYPPDYLWEGTLWELMFDDEGTFFRTEGNESSLFGSGTQGYAIESHRHGGDTYRSYTNKPAGLSGMGTYDYKSYIYSNGSTYTSYAGGSETRPSNRTIRIWRRIA